MLQVELQRGSSRPDIVIEDIAIEIKEPTYEEGLQSIADKCLRYHHDFKKMIFVLFNIRTKIQRFYDEWEDGFKKIFSRCHDNQEINLSSIRTKHELSFRCLCF
jgi:hypothetical protein